MPQTIPQQPEIGRLPNDGDLLVIEKAEGGTRKLDFAALKQLFRLKTFFYKGSFEGQTEIAVPGLDSSSQVIAIKNMQILEEFTSDDILLMESGFFKAYYSQNKILLADGLSQNEKILIIHN